jgi:hypothetical protein
MIAGFGLWAFEERFERATALLCSAGRGKFHFFERS